MGVISFSASVSASIADGFCFVPRSSALDIQAGNSPFASFTGGYSNKLGYNRTATDNYITQEKRFSYPASQEGLANNAEHTAFSDRQTWWLFNEMQNNVPAVRLNCPANQDCDEVSSDFRTPAITVFGITYGLKIRRNIAGNYSVASSPVVNSYVWSISGGATIASGQGTAVVSVGGLSGGVNYTLSVVVRSNCWTRTTSETVTCDKPVATLSPAPHFITRKITACLPAGAPQMYFTSGPQNRITVRSISLGINFLNYSFPATGSIYAYTPSSPTSDPFAELSSGGYVRFLRYGDYEVASTNSCNIPSDYTFFRLEAAFGCRVVAPTPEIPLFTVSPNPSSGNEITISQEVSKSETSASTGEEQALSEAKNEEFTLVLYNKLQVKVRETTLNTLSKTISTEGLPNGVYFLHIIDKDGNKVVKQVMILR